MSGNWRTQLEDLAADLVTLRVTTYVVPSLDDRALSLGEHTSHAQFMGRMHARVGAARTDPDAAGFTVPGAPASPLPDTLPELRSHLESLRTSDPGGFSIPADPDPTDPVEVALEDLRTLEEVGAVGADGRLAAHLPPKARVAVQKVWSRTPEAKAVMLTDVRLDGDVTTHVDEDWARSEHLPALLSVHELSLRSSMRMWQNLVQAITALIRTVGEWATGG